ncbi:hypothetical protein MCOR27_001026 [Pyricularia oryzae]|uniref:Uncharacterized protein n=1 Tax=Pyricularia grisea TaxID=148305 RepID=A0ABQ8NW88_PYRGI|nr:hypothetical protein MCOR19_006700 [Pyricularia oryzae]KAI6303068.1 hypothetical protein MCOR33_001666 [Pyricularia grisea]KAI6273941.1 hypothetical protein MCOR26_006691 [Pyricularia oryzae]KAI6288354.1 hypothetical protein MCOR27_001026 [Pyricularia oryzae]KAI6310904.1 hypothetical protein MCOR30_010987 [Pyricularia oryzae]
MVIMGLQLLLTAALSLCLGAIAQSCTSYGVDYSNGGSYYIDSSSNDYFSFVSEFQGCYRESISPVLIDPDNNQYACSAIEIGDSGAKVTSLCYIPFSAMRTGQWKLVLAGRQISTQRTINLKVGPLATTTVTATPTVIVGITSTPRAITIVSTIFKTETLVLPPKTTTRDCNIGQTQTVTVYPPTRTVTTQSIVTRTSTAGPVTKALTTTLVTTAKCHWPTKKPGLQAMAAITATTVTVTQTTSTVTYTSITTLPTPTTTEITLKISTQTITPPPLTACNSNKPGATVTITRGTASVITETKVVYITTTVTGTVFVGSTVYSTATNPISATACWRAGGWYGRR